MTQALEELAGLLERPLRRGRDAAPHEQPWRGRSGPSLAVAVPADTEEVRSVVRWARRHGVRLLPQGAATGLVGASTPPPEGPAPLVVSTEALDEGPTVDPAAAVAVAGAGVRLSRLNEVAGHHRLELPVDLAADPALGGMVATNTGGSRVLRHGDMSRWVLGLEAVVADEQVSVIGRVRGLRKDNTGPDPAQVFLGSAGAFGIITRVAVALEAVPEERVAALVGPLGDHRAVELLALLRRDLGERLSAFEVMCPSAMRAALEHMAEPPAVDPGEDPDVTALVEVSGPPGGDRALVDAVAAAGADLSGRALLVPVGDAWGLRHAITDGLRREGTVIGFDLSVHPLQLPELRRRVREVVAGNWPTMRVADFGHWGDGGIHCNVVSPPEDADAGRVAALRDSVYHLVADLGGSFSAEHGIGPANAEWWRRTTPAATRGLLAAIRHRLDPAGVMGHPDLPF